MTVTEKGERPTVYVVDDDEAVRDSLSFLMESVQLRVEPYASPTEFLNQYNPEQPGCLVLDLRMPEMSGLDVFRALRRRGGMPVLFITAHGSVPVAVQAIQDGAVDFLEKPVNQQVLIDRVLRAVSIDARARENQVETREILERFQALTEREREVLLLVVAGDANKVIADRLAVSPKTVETHRARVMQKMQAESLAELVRMTVSARLGKKEPPVN